MWRTQPRGIGWASALALAFAFATFAAHIALGWNSATRGSDFNAYLVGAALLEQGDDPYTTDRLLWDRTAVERGLLPVHFRYRYPIHLAWILQPGLDVQPQTLWLANAVLYAVLAVAGAVACALALGGGWRVPWAIFLIGSAGAMAETISLGQVTGFVLFFLGTGYLFLQRQSTGPFALIVATGAALKLLPIVLVATALAARAWRIAGLALLATAFVFLLPTLTLGDDHLWRFVRELREIVSLPDWRANNQSLLAAAHRLGWPAHVGHLARLGVLLLLGWLAWQQWREPDAVRGHALFGALLSAALLVPVTAFFLYQPWQLFALLFACEGLWRNDRKLTCLALCTLHFVCQALYVLPQVLHRLMPAQFSVPQDVFADLGQWPAALSLSLFLSCIWLGRRSRLAPPKAVVHT